MTRKLEQNLACILPALRSHRVPTFLATSQNLRNRVRWPWPVLNPQKPGELYILSVSCGLLYYNDSRLLTKVGAFVDMAPTQHTHHKAAK